MTKMPIDPWGLPIRRRKSGSTSWRTVGTGVRVAKDLVLTARHVVSTGEPGSWQNVPMDALSIFDSESSDILDILVMAGDATLDVALLRVRDLPAGECVTCHPGQWSPQSVFVARGWPLLSKVRAKRGLWRVEGKAHEYGHRDEGWMLRADPVPTELAGLSGAGVCIEKMLAGIVSFKPEDWSEGTVVGVPIQRFQDWLKGHVAQDKVADRLRATEECVAGLRKLDLDRQFAIALKVEVGALVSRIGALGDLAAVDLWNEVDVKVRGTHNPAAGSQVRESRHSTLGVREAAFEWLLKLLPFLESADLVVKPAQNVGEHSREIGATNLGQVALTYAREDQTPVRAKAKGRSLVLPRTLGTPAALLSPVCPEENTTLDALYGGLSAITETNELISRELGESSPASTARALKREWDDLEDVVAQLALSPDTAVRGRATLFVDKSAAEGLGDSSWVVPQVLRRLIGKVPSLRIVLYQRKTGSNTPRRLAVALNELAVRLETDSKAAEREWMGGTKS
jgi:hypothetical protein